MECSHLFKLKCMCGGAGLWFLEWTVEGHSFFRSFQNCQFSHETSQGLETQGPLLLVTFTNGYFSFLVPRSCLYFLVHYNPWKQRDKCSPDLKNVFGVSWQNAVKRHTHTSKHTHTSRHATLLGEAPGACGDGLLLPRAWSNPKQVVQNPDSTASRGWKQAPDLRILRFDQIFSPVGKSYQVETWNGHFCKSKIAPSNSMPPVN